MPLRSPKGAGAKINNPPLLLISLIFLLLCPSLCIHPTSNIIANPNTQSSPSNFMFSFMLQKPLPVSGYLLITFSSFTTSAIPTSCVSLSSSATVSSCSNLNTNTGSLTITQTAINQVNPNIVATKTVVILFTAALSANTQYKIQVITSNVLPNIGSISQSFQMYTVTSDGVIIQQNWNFGQVYLEPKQNKALSVVSRNSMVSNLPGLSFTSLLFQITIGVATPTNYARLKFVISGGFLFTDSSLVNTQALVGVAPTILTRQIVSPNVIIATFNQSFPVNRKFYLTIAQYKNPLSISSGYISVYHLPYNSISPLQISQQSIPLQTIPFTPVLSILTVDGTAPSKPIQFYTSTVQYIKLTISVPMDIPTNYVISIDSDTLVLHEGSAYAKTSTISSSLLQYTYSSDKTAVVISGFPLIPANSVITVTMRVQVPVNPIFSIVVKVDLLANLASSIISGTITSNSAAVPDTFITGLTGSSGQTNKLSAMQTTDSSVIFTVTPSFSTNAGSSLQIITNKYMLSSSSFSTSTSCLVGGAAQPCSIVTNDTFTIVTIASNTSYNLFPQATATLVTINNLVFKVSSSHTEYVYHFYYQLTVSLAVSASTKCQLLVPIVIPQRYQLTSLNNYISNNLKNSGTNYPNILRIVSWATSQFQNTIQVYQKRILSIFCYQGWTQLFTLSSGDAYPAGSSLSGFTFTYIQGTTSSLTLQYPLDWDRVDIIMDGNQSTSYWSVILPTLFTTSQIHFQIYVGVYNTITRTVSYLNIMQQPISGNPTYLLTGSALLSQKPKVTTNKIQLAGNSGSYKTSTNISITPGSSSYSYSALTYASAVVFVSDWQWFDSTSAFAASSLASLNPIFKNVQQMPLSFYLPINQKYLTYIPIKTLSTYSTNFLIYLLNIKLPYTADLPYYSIYLIDGTGTIDSYNQFINQDKSVFYSSYLKSLTFTCNVASLGVTNTYCTLTFVPNNQIEVGSVFRVSFTGMHVSTNMCTMTMLPSTAIPSSCLSNTDKNQTDLTISNTYRLTPTKTYSITIYGISIVSSTIIHYITAEIRDPTSSYIIESGKRILLTSVAQSSPIYINQIKYSKNNPIVYSSFQIKFTLPRQLNPDEIFAIVMSKDLANLNTIQSKLNVVLIDSNNVTIDVVWYLSIKNYRIVFQGLSSVLAAGSYTVTIYGIKTPSTIGSDLISIIYYRSYDNTYTISNIASSSSSFPSLSQKINSYITMTPLFNTQGLQQQLVFTFNNQFQPVSPQTIWVLNLPRYYSQNLWNQDFMIYCTIDSIVLDCERDQTTRYQIVISNSPRIVQINTEYVIKVYGLACPRAAYLNGNADYVTESVFMGIAESESSQAYMEYSQLFLTQTIVDPSGSGYGSIVITGVSSSNMQVLQTTYMVINCTSTVTINAGQSLYITFPSAFDNFNDLSITIKIVQAPISQTYTANVVNRRLGFNMTSNSLASGAIFSIQVSSLPTPSTAGKVDMNQLRIMASTLSNDATTAASMQLHNLVGYLTFVPSSLSVVINRYATIMITAGTYSLPVKIQASDYLAFVSNMKINFVSPALSFSPSPAYVYLGDKYSTFSVGADQTLIPTLYAFDIIKTQASISAFYTSLSKYTVLVTNIPVTVTIPSTFTVPRGGCSVPYKISLNNPPYSDISLQFQYDTLLYNLHTFWLNQQTSYNSLSFDSGTNSRWLSFCADASLAVGVISVTAILGGTNVLAYSLSNTNINVNIVANTTTNVSPVFGMVLKNVQKTYVGFELTSNINGQIYYQISVSPLVSMDLISLKSSVKQQSLLLTSQSDYLSHIYLQNRYHRVGIQNILIGANTLQFSDLMPGLSYTLCVYLQNQHRTAAQQKCTQFTTLNWGTIIKAIITFNSTVYQSQLNKVLCFFVKASQSKINQIADINGNSCSLSSTPQNYYYKYTGTTISSELKQTIVYFITNTNMTTDPSLTKFNNNFNSSNNNAISSTSLSLALSTFAVNYIQSSYLKGTFQPETLTAKSSSYNPVFSSSGSTFDGTSTIYIKNVMLDRPGTVYFVLTFSRRIVYDQVAGHTDIDIRPALVPSQEQLLNCQDGYGGAPLDCKRAIFLGGEAKTISFSNISANSLYIVYYGVANQYPLRPVMVTSVNNFSVLTNFGTVSERVFTFAAIFIMAFSYV